MPFIEDETVREAFCRNIERSKSSQADLSNGRLNLKKLDTFFMQASKDLNDSLNNCQCDTVKPLCTPQPISHPPLINVPFLKGLSVL